ncbi:G5 domain-containing protein [Leifsonia sp. ZF2019]|uniref:G5 domain-containing protein n=1 Tax=Leifsonia sp. ZF2019 TaxID=2781978 RepID=UPI001CC00055|nr:G5 domain-containing protein [Leifsonia sp. ZF2019]
MTRRRLTTLGWPIAAAAAALAVVVGVSAYAAGGRAPAEVAESDASSFVSVPTASVPHTPQIEVTTVDVEVALPFASTTVDDPGLDAGVRSVTTEGRDGVTTRRYSVTLVDGAETSRTLVSETVTTPPVDQVTSVGTRQPAPAAEAAPPPQQQGTCDPNYSGACVPIDSDVDCAGGSGNGPSYVSGPVQVVGTDIYDLDRDGDGVGCE